MLERKGLGFTEQYVDRRPSGKSNHVYVKKKSLLIISAVALYAKTEYNDDNYQKFIDYVVNETGVDRERFNSSFEIGSD